MSFRSRIRAIIKYLMPYFIILCIASCPFLFSYRSFSDFKEAIGYILLFHIFFSARSAYRAAKARQSKTPILQPYRDILVTAFIVAIIFALCKYVSLHFTLVLLMSINVAWWVVHDLMSSMPDDADIDFTSPLFLISHWLRVRGSLIMAMIVWWWLKQPEAALVIMVGGGIIAALWELEEDSEGNHSADEE